MLHQAADRSEAGRVAEHADGGELDPHSDQGATVRELKRQYDRRVKLPQKLVEELARTTTLGQQAWAVAREKNDFASFRPLLEKIFQLKREQRRRWVMKNIRTTRYWTITSRGR